MRPFTPGLGWVVVRTLRLVRGSHLLVLPKTLGARRWVLRVDSCALRLNSFFGSMSDVSVRRLQTAPVNVAYASA